LVIPVTRTENLKSFRAANEPARERPVAYTGNMVNLKDGISHGGSQSQLFREREWLQDQLENLPTKERNFVDILERLNVLFSNNGYVLNSTTDGCIQMKHLKVGNL
jgi:AP-4 complex subunit mu-1